MNRIITCAIAVVFTLSGSAMAADWLFFGLDLTGTIMDSPATYTGPLTYGATGTFSFTLDDTGWPDPSNQEARWDHIFNTYFAMNYDNSVPGAFAWKGNLPGTFTLDITSAMPGFVGTVGGGVQAEVTLKDVNSDGIFNPYEREGDDNSINATLSIPCDAGTGEMAEKRGGGAFQANNMSFPFLPATDAMPGSGNISLEPCTTSTEPSSWGRIKALYR